MTGKPNSLSCHVVTGPLQNTKMATTNPWMENEGGGGELILFEQEIERVRDLTHTYGFALYTLYIKVGSYFVFLL